MKTIRISRFAALLLALATPLSAQVTTGWLGDRTGVYPKADVPLEWGSDTHVIWSCDLPEWGNATPAIVGDRIFVTAEPDTVICIDKTGGKILWQKSMAYENTLTPEQRQQAAKDRTEAKPIEAELNTLRRQARQVGGKLRRDRNNAELKKQMAELRARIEPLQKKLEPLQQFQLPKTNPTNGYMSASPITDGKNVYVLTGAGVAGCFTPEGEVVWMRHIQKPTHAWGHSASPVLADGKLILHILDLFALDPTTGDEIWKTKTPVIWGTHLAATVGDTTVVVTPAGALVRARDGKVIGQLPVKLEFNSPVLVDRTLYCIQNGGGAFELPEQAGERIEVKTLWRTEPKKERYYASPIVHDGLIYCISRFLDFVIIDATDGKVLDQKKLDELGKGRGTQAYPSQIVAGGHVLLSADSGRTLVMKPDKQFNEVRINELETFRSTPVVEGDRMYIRTYPKLYCIGTK